MTPLEIRPLDIAGAEVFGADLARISVGDWNQLEAAFAAFGLLVFRRQIVSEAELVGFARRWGTVSGVASRAPHPDHPEIELVDPDADARSWRCEGSYLVEPPLGSVLTIPGVSGSGTVSRFCDLASAHAALSSSTQRELEGLTATHVGPDSTTAQHPVVIRHPLSGRKVLFVNPTFTASIDGMEELNALALLNQLTEHCQDAEFVCELHWEPGTVALVDHRAISQFGGPAAAGDDPVTHRVQIAGCGLNGVVVADERDPTLVQRAGATLAGGVLTAAMTGIAEVIEPEKVQHDVEIVSEAPEEEPLHPLDFGHLPPID